ncbi:MAG: PorV/PorQ family protein [Candidatus Hydrothermales bacterium]
MVILTLLKFLILGAWGMPGSFMLYSPSAKSFALGSAYTAFVGDPASIYFNPSGIAESNPQEIQFSQSFLPLGGNYGWIGYVRPTKKIGNFGCGFLFMNSGKTKITDPENKFGGNFVHFESALFLTYAREFSNYFDFGFSYKLLYKSISRFSSVGHAFDLGFIFLPQNVLKIGVSFLNLLNVPYKLIEESEKIPLTIRAGALSSFFEGKFNLLLDFYSVNEWNENHYSLGVEYTPIDVFSVRIGITKYSFTAGSGVYLKLPGKKIGIDVGGSYHYESNNLFPFTGFITLYFQFAGFRVEVTPHTRVFSPRSPENNILRIDLFTQAKKEVERWQFLIKDYKGEVKKVYKDFGETPREILWDGRDDLGILVQDGLYYYEFRVVQKDGSVLIDTGFLAEVRTIGPKGEIFYREKVEKEEVEEEKKEEEVK